MANVVKRLVAVSFAALLGMAWMIGCSNGPALSFEGDADAAPEQSEDACVTDVVLN